MRHRLGRFAEAVVGLAQQQGDPADHLGRAIVFGQGYGAGKLRACLFEPPEPVKRRPPQECKEGVRVESADPHLTRQVMRPACERTIGLVEQALAPPGMDQRVGQQQRGQRLQVGHGFGLRALVVFHRNGVVGLGIARCAERARKAQCQRQPHRLVADRGGQCIAFGQHGPRRVDVDPGAVIEVEQVDAGGKGSA